MSTNNQPTILVKRADGSSERITLEEFRARKSGKGSASQPSTSVQSQPEQLVDASEPAASTPLEPVLEQPSSAPQKKAFTITDLLGDLEKNQLPLRNDADQYNLRTELQKAGKIPVPPTSEKTVHDSDKEEIDDAPIARDQGAEKIINQQTVSPVQRVNPAEIFAKPVDPQPKQEQMSTEHAPNWEKEDHGSLLDEPFEEPLPASVPTQQQDSAPVLQSGSQSIDSIQEKPTAPEQGDPILVRAQKPVIHDIMPSQKAAYAPVGPVEEIAQFDLKQFRALGHSVEDAKQLFFQKFSLLKKESYLLYMDAKKAWHQSPLFAQYRDMTVTALASKQPLKQFMGTDPQGIDLTEEEFHSLIWLNTQLMYS